MKSVVRTEDAGTVVNMLVVSVLVLLQLQEVEGKMVVAEMLVLGPGVTVMKMKVVAVAV